MTEFPPKSVDDETFSETVIVYSEGLDDQDLGYYDFETKKWTIFGGFSMKLLCWAAVPNPKEFMKDKNYPSVTHKGYQS